MRTSSKLLPVILIALAGCASAPQRQQQAPVVEQSRTGRVPQPAPPAAKLPGGAAQPSAARQSTPSAPPQPSPSESTQSAPTAGPAVIALLDQARTQAGKGQGEEAAATLERALRIEPQNAWVWHRLAVLRLQQGRWDQAMDLATKSMTLAGTDARLLGGNWEVIARAREGKGDHAGARRAHERAQSYFNQAR